MATSVGEKLLKTWQGCATSEEVVLDDSFILDQLRNAPETRATIERHVETIKRVLMRLPRDVAESYAEWCLDPDFYRFASEAFHQGRILYWLSVAARFRDISQMKRMFVARQIIRPSGLNSTPRIKSTADVEFIVYPAPSTAWLYEMMGILACERKNEGILEKKLEEYVLYLLAYRAYTTAADFSTAFGIDYLIDEIVLKGQPPHFSHPVSDEAAFFIQAVEDFVINHEIAHAMLEHSSAGHHIGKMESDADNLAIELMLAEFVKDLPDAGEHQIRVPDRPLIGYLCLNLWGLFRETAEWRASLFLADTPDKMQHIRERTRNLKDARLTRIGDVPNFSGVIATDQAKDILNAGLRVNQRFQELRLDQERAEDVVRLSRSLAQRNYAVLRQEILDETERMKREVTL
jgi:hypothetical protein